MHCSVSEQVQFTKKDHFASKQTNETNFFPFKSPLLVKLTRLAYRPAQAHMKFREFLGDRSTGELPASPRFLDRLTLARKKTSASALQIEQQLIEPFHPK